MLDFMISEALSPGGAAAGPAAEGGAAGGAPALLQSLQRTMTSMQRFMKSLSN